MVKVQKPNPKSIKRNALGNTKKTLLKKSNVNSTKEKVKKTASALKTVAENKLVKNGKQKVNTNQKIKKQQLLETVKKSPLKKPAIVKEEETTIKKKPLKKPAIVKEEETTIKKKPLKKKVLTEAHETTVKKNILKKTTGAKVKGNVQKNIEKKSSVGTKKEKKILSPALKVGKKTQVGVKIANKNKKNGAQKQVETKEKADSVKQGNKIFEAIDFDEENFKDIVSLENIKKITKALKTLVEEEVSQKKTAIFSDYKYFLNVASYKIANCPKRMVKLNLKHSLVDTKSDDVVMIVPDLKRGAKVDYEPTIQHYEELLRDIGMENIKIVPFNQLRNECKSFEAKRKFANTYDYFMCDGRIVGHAAGFCGKFFQKPRTTIHAVRLDNPKTYKKDIEHALCRTSYRQLEKGDLISILVGNDRFTTNQLSENIEHVIEQLKTLFAGGYANIRSMHIKIDIRGTSSLPLYINMGGAPSEVPNIIGPREQRMIKLKKEANDILSKFNMSKSGEFVKLSKTQVKHKLKMRALRAALLSKESTEVEDTNDELNPPAKKKVKKDQSASDDDVNENDSDNSDNEDNEISGDE